NVDFSYSHTLKGHRFYYRLSLAEIVPAKSTFFGKVKPVLKLLDFFGNLFLDVRFIFVKKKNFTEIQPAKFDEKLEKFISNHNRNSLFKRNMSDFKWILDFPWVEQKDKDDETDRKYHFTTSAKRFFQKAITIKSDGEIKGFLFYSVKNAEMKIHYIFGDSEKETEKFAEFILNEIRKEKISYLVMTDDKLIQ